MSTPFDPNSVGLTFSDAPVPDTDPVAPKPDVPVEPPPVPEKSRGIRDRIMGEQRRDTPPKQPRRPTTKEEKPTPPKPREGQLVKPLTDMYASIGMMVFAFDQECGGAVMESAEQCAIALDKAARESPAVRRVVMRMIETSVMGQIIAAHAPIAIRIAKHHVPAMQTPAMPRPMVPPESEPMAEQTTNEHPGVSRA